MTNSLLAAGKIKAELDDGTGTYPYDVTAFVDMKIGYSISRGRANEFSTIDASALSLTFRNDGGQFTLGNVSSPYLPFVGQGIRFSIKKSGGTYVKRFTGNVNTWPVEWPGGKKQSKVAIAASDRLARLARRSFSSTAIDAEILTTKPNIYLPLDDAVGSTTARDVSGNSWAAAIQAGTGSDVVFGSNAAPGSDDATCASFAAGKCLQQKSGPLYPYPGPPYVGAYMLAFSTSFATTQGIFGNFTGVNSYLEISAGALTIDGNVIATGLADGNAHVVGVLFTGSNAADVYVDGVLANSFVVGTPALLDDWRIGSDNGGPGFIGRISNVAIWSTATAPTAAQMASITAGLKGYVAERSDQRIARFAKYASIAAADQSLEVGVQLMGPIGAIKDQSVVEMMRAVEAAEQGLIFINGGGQLVFQNRSHRYTRAASVTIPGAYIGSDSRFSADDQLLYNQASISASGGTPQIVKNQASIASMELYPYEADLALRTDEEAFEVASWIVNASVTARPRVVRGRVDLLIATAALHDSMLDLEISDVVTITGIPSQAAATTFSGFAEGWTETGTKDAWSMELNTSPTTDYNVWTLEDPVYGAYDSNPLAL